jgi:hypothetical protein
VKVSVSAIKFLQVIKPVRAELVEALFFFLQSRQWKKMQPFDKLRANGIGLFAAGF